jgi:hypothetical protein
MHGGPEMRKSGRDPSEETSPSLDFRMSHGYKNPNQRAATKIPSSLSRNLRSSTVPRTQFSFTGKSFRY